jgi:hypothetical protein
MDPFDPETTDSDRPVPASSGITPHPVPTTQGRSLDQQGRLLVFTIAAGILAGVASLLVGEVILNRYQSDLVPTIKTHPSPEDMRRWRDARVYSATLTFTTMGGVLGLMMGLAGGLARRSVLASTWAAMGGLLVGTAAGACMSLALVSNFYKRHDPQSGDLVLPMLTHGAIWSAVGAIGGLAFGLGLGGKGRWKATVVGGLVGAAAATVIYELVGALAFATSKTDLPLSSSITTRGLAQLLVAILSAVGAVVALRQSPKKEDNSSVPS